MGAVTALLVLAANLSAIMNDLPKTAYVKLIDFWFLGHIISISLIIAFHVLIDKIEGTQGLVATIAIRPMSNETVNETGESFDKQRRTNNILVYALPGLMITTYAVYFSLTIQYYVSILTAHGRVE